MVLIDLGRWVIDWFSGGIRWVVSIFHYPSLVTTVNHCQPRLRMACRGFGPSLSRTSHGPFNWRVA